MYFVDIVEFFEIVGALVGFAFASLVGFFALGKYKDFIADGTN